MNANLKRFFRKNAFLTGVLGITALLGVLLLTLAVFQLISWQKASARIDKMQSSVKQLLKQKPSAVRGNIALLQQDIDGYTAATLALQEHFGQPYRIALRKFVTALEIPVPQDEDEENAQEAAPEPSEGEPAKPALTPEQLAALKQQKQLQHFEAVFREFWDREKSAKLPPDKIYGRLRNFGSEKDAKVKWSQADWDKAFKNVFCTEVAKLTLEPINENNAPEIFLSSLGLPRTMNNKDEFFAVFTRNMEKAVTAQLDEHKIQYSRPQITGESGSRSSGSRRSSASAPDRMTNGSQDGKVAAIRDWENKADLLSRVARSGISSLEAFSSDSAQGVELGNYRYHTYALTVRGSMASIRDLLNGLMKAYPENRVYVVRSIKIKKVEDQAQDLIDFAMGVITKPEDQTTLQVEGRTGQQMAPGMMNPNVMGPGMMNPNAMEPGMMPGANPNASGKMSDKGKDAPAFRHFLERGIYGEVVLGRNELCEAEITVDYVTFIKNEIKDE